MAIWHLKTKIGESLEQIKQEERDKHKQQMSDWGRLVDTLIDDLNGY